VTQINFRRIGVRGPFPSSGKLFDQSLTKSNSIIIVNVYVRHALELEHPLLTLLFFFILLPLLTLSIVPVENMGWVVGSLKWTTPSVAMGRKAGGVFVVDEDRCYGCAACVALCPVDALILEGWLVIVDEPTCTHCEICIPACPVFALDIVAAKS
jgi:electron transport complex protein RnfB